MLSGQGSARCTRSASGWRREGDGLVRLNREVPERAALFFVITLFPARQQPSIFGVGAIKLPDPPGKPFGNPLGTTVLEPAVEDHQTNARAGQKKLLEVIVDFPEIVPFALRGQGCVNKFFCELSLRWGRFSRIRAK